MSEWATILLSEFIGTALLILLGNAVVSNVVLKNTKGHNSGWIVIAAGWGFAVMFAALISTAAGAHLNPAVSIMLIIAKAISGSDVIDLKSEFIAIYFIGQILGAILGQLIVVFMYLPHYRKTTDPGAILATFSTAPAERSIIHNLFSEFIGTVVLGMIVFATIGMKKIMGDTNLIGKTIPGPMIVGLGVFAIGLSLGGTTGYAINPVRDFIPRIVHFILPLKNKGTSDWSYSWIPVVGPFCGAIAVGLLGSIFL